MEQEQEEAGCGVGGGSSEDQGPPCQGQKSKEKFLDFHLYFTSALQVCRFLNNIFFFIFLFRVSNPTEDGHESGRAAVGHGPHPQEGKMQTFFVWKLTGKRYLFPPLFLPAAKPSGPRTVGVVVVVVGGGGSSLSECNFAAYCMRTVLRLHKFPSGWDPALLMKLYLIFFPNKLSPPLHQILFFINAAGL